MSFDFWLDLGIALGLFALTVLALPQVRMRLLKRSRAKKLRPRLAAAMEQLLAHIARPAEQSDHAETHRAHSLHVALMGLQGFIDKERVLFTEEQDNLLAFRKKLKQIWPQISSAAPRTRELEDLILFGQRIVSDMREHNS